MKVSELRLGNYILHNGEVMPVVQIERRYKTIFRLNDMDVDERIIEDHFQPIPLTPEWLERCGYEYSKPDEKWYKKGSSLGPIYHIYNGAYGIQGLGTHPGSNFKYLHHFQNLYFALTGEELTINNDHLQSTSSRIS